MPHPGRVPVVACAFVALALFVALSCDSPFEPRGEGERVPIGQIISGSLSAPDTLDRYSFVAPGGQEFAVFFEVTQGAALLSVSDSASGQPLGSVFDAAGSTGLYETATPNFTETSRAVLRIEVRRSSTATEARYRLLIYRVDRAPENRPARFTIGDTVAGEAVTPIADIDEFVAAGVAGQQAVGWVEALGSAGSGTVSLIVTDPQSSNPLAFAYATAGASGPLVLTGPFAFPGSRDYRFTLSPVMGFGGARYTGSFRFRFYTINPAPESVIATIAPNTVVVGEALDVGGDVDEFTFSAADGQEFNAFIQSTADGRHRIVSPVSLPDQPGAGALARCGDHR